MVCQWKLESSVMSTPMQPLTWLVVGITGWVQRDQQAAIVYLLEENRVLKARLRGRKLRLTDDERHRLAVKGKALGRKLLAEVVGIVTPETNRLHFAAAALPRADHGFTRCRSFFQTTSFSAIVPILKSLANLLHCCVDNLEPFRAAGDQRVKPFALLHALADPVLCQNSDSHDIPSGQNTRTPSGSAVCTFPRAA